jgi:hypothetical protein
MMPTRHDNDPKALLAARRREVAKSAGKTTGRGSGLTPRIRQALDHLVFGVDGNPGAIVRMQDAATSAGLTCRALRAAMLKPAVESYYNRQMAAMRNGERAASIRKMVEIRDDAAMAKSPAGRKQQLDAAKALAFDTPATTINVNNGTIVNIDGIHEKAGYVIDLTPPSHRLEQQPPPARQVIDVEPAPAWREIGE